MELLGAFPDAEDVALVLLAAVGLTVLARPERITPPLVVVRRVGGSDDRITDQPLVRVQCFGGTHAQARDMAERCRQLVLAAPATQVAGVAIDRAWTESAAVFVDYGVPSLHRYVATYRFEYRRPR